GKTLSRCWGTRVRFLSAGFAGTLFGDGFGRFGGRCLGGGRHGRASFALGIRFRLGGGLLRGRLLLDRLGVGVRLGRFCRRLLGCRLCGFGTALRLAAALGDTFVDQRDGLRQRDGLFRLVARDGGVDATRGDIGAITAALDRDST